MNHSDVINNVWWNNTFVIHFLHTDNCIYSTDSCIYSFRVAKAIYLEKQMPVEGTFCIIVHIKNSLGDLMGTMKICSFQATNGTVNNLNLVCFAKYVRNAGQVLTAIDELLSPNDELASTGTCRTSSRKELLRLDTLQSMHSVRRQTCVILFSPSV